MAQLIPSSEDLEEQIFATLEGVTEDERDEWLRHPCTLGLAIFFETLRMKALEGLEAGTDERFGAFLAGQAQTSQEVRKFITRAIAQVDKDDEASD